MKNNFALFQNSCRDVAMQLVETLQCNVSTSKFIPRFGNTSDSYIHVF
ncbi:MAG: hypothetical protein RMX98_010805 [Nostoc sp. DedQUE02]